MTSSTFDDNKRSALLFLSAAISLSQLCAPNRLSLTCASQQDKEYQAFPQNNAIQFYP